MYFEEKIINGVLCWRDTPTGEWRPYSVAEISAKYKHVQSRLAQNEVEAPGTIDNMTKAEIKPNNLGAHHSSACGCRYCE